MLIYKQRYKPRTSRAFTKSDLTVYDSAGNTALNTLTVYGKSEVVNDKIISAGEGYAAVDLGTLDYTIDLNIGGYGRIYTASLTNVIQKINSSLLCSKFNQTTALTDVTSHENGYMFLSQLGNISFSRNGYETEADFKSAMSGVLLCYQLADPTQGNAIAVKIDNGTGIDGTMAVFETGTPLYGVSDSIRDVMQWDGSSGKVTKNCRKVRLADLTWNSGGAIIYYAGVPNLKMPTTEAERITGIFSNKYTVSTVTNVNNMPDKSMLRFNASIFIKDSDYTTVSDFTASLGDAELVYELATPITTPLTTAENASIAGLRTFEPTTHAQNNAQTDMTVDYTIRVPTI